MYVQDIEIESSVFHTTSYPAVADSHDIIVVDATTEKVDVWFPPFDDVK